MHILVLMLFDQECVNRAIPSLLIDLLATDTQSWTVWEIVIILLETEIPVILIYQMSLLGFFLCLKWLY